MEFELIEAVVVRDVLNKVNELLQDKKTDADSWHNQMEIWDGVSLESSFNYCTSKYRYEINKNWKDELESIYSNPYFGRMVFRTINQSINDVKIGLYDTYYRGAVLIHDWRSDYGNFFYQNEKSKYLGLSNEVLLLKRKVHIEKSVLIDYTNVYDQTLVGETDIVDPFLMQILIEKRKNPYISNIVSTIQKNQNSIIRGNYDDSVLVKGCAGSGKTMVMLHKISYLSYNYKQDRDSYQIIVPSDIYIQQVKTLMKELKIDDIKIQTLDSLYHQIIQASSVKLGLPTLGKNYSDTLSNEQIRYILSNEFLYDMKLKYENRLNEINIDRLISSFQILQKHHSIDVENLFEKPYNSIVGLNRLRMMITEIKNAVVERTRFQNIRKTLAVEIPVLESDLKSRYELKENYKLKLEFLYDVARHNGFIGDKVLFTNQVYLFNQLYKCVYSMQLGQYKGAIREARELFNYFIKAKLYPDLTIGKLVSLELLINNISGDRKYPSIEDQLWSFILPIEKCLYETKDDSLRRGFVKGTKARFDRIYDTESDEQKLFQMKKDNEAAVEFLQDEKSHNIKQSEMEFLLGLESDLNNVIDNKPYVFKKILKETLQNVNVEEIDGFIQRPTRISLFAQTVFLSIIGEISKVPYSHISIDEAQDISEVEYDVLSSFLKSDTKLCLYGDLNQAISRYASLNSWDNIVSQFGLVSYELKENYRNSRQITEFTNKIFNQNVTSIAIDDAEVKMIGLNEFIDILEFEYKDREKCRIAIILNDIHNPQTEKSVLWPLKNKFTDLRFNEVSSGTISILDLKVSKGLEFEKVFVFEKDLNRNQKYVAYTRALNKLFVVS